MLQLAFVTRPPASPPRTSDGLCCPRCGGALGADGSGFAWTRCARAYPVVGRIPVLVEDPVLWRTLWLRRLHDFLTGVEVRIAGLRQEAEGPDLLPRTRAAC